MTFEERAKLGKKLLLNQRPITLEIAKKQVLWLKTKKTTKNVRFILH